MVAVAVQETWQIPLIETVQIKDFTFFCKTRSNCAGGGVGIYVRNEYAAKVNPHLSPFIEKNIESISVEIKFKNRKISITSLYRPPNNSSPDTDLFFDNYENLLNLMNKNDTNYIILTDSNFNLLKLPHCKLSQKYLEITHGNGFLQLIKKATRIQSTSFSLIDHILSKNEKFEMETGVITEDISDHFFTFCSFKEKAPTPKQPTITKRNFSEKNITDFKNALAQINFSSVLTHTDANLAFNDFWETFLALFDIYFPLESTKFNKKSHKINKFMTEGLLVSREKKRPCKKLAW